MIGLVFAMAEFPVVYYGLRMRTFAAASSGSESVNPSENQLVRKTVEQEIMAIEILLGAAFLGSLALFVRAGRCLRSWGSRQLVDCSPPERKPSSRCLVRSILTNFIMRDGSRAFVSLPSTVEWSDFEAHITKLPGAKLKGVLTDQITEAWFDFRFRGYKFSVHETFGEYSFFVSDPMCPEEVLAEVTSHFESLLLRPST